MRIPSNRCIFSLILVAMQFAIPGSALSENSPEQRQSEQQPEQQQPEKIHPEQQRAALLQPELQPELQPPDQQQRQEYDTAVAAIRAGKWQDFQALRPGLDEYPLSVYLDYYQLTAQLSRVRPQDASSFLARSADSPLPQRFLSLYLRRAGAARRWSDFLTVWPQEPNSIELKCYHFRALLAQGDKEAAYAGAKRLWVHGKSQPKSCDPLFAAWEAAGELTDDLVWERMRAAFSVRQGSLMRYISHKGSGALQPWSERLQRVYRDPSRLDIKGLSATHARTAQLVSSGLTGLARYSPEKALARWQDYSTRLTFTPEQTQTVEYAIALQGLFARSDDLRQWLPDVLSRQADDKLVGIRLRWALAEQDWDTFMATLPLLSDEERESSTWRYWQALALIDAGRKDEAGSLLLALAADRGFYSFLAADYLKTAYAFNSRPPLMAQTPHLKA
ncbi:MAG: soluble lytic murein transglycosylase, partial [Bacteroidia bacterium]